MNLLSLSKFLSFSSGQSADTYSLCATIRSSSDVHTSVLKESENNWIVFDEKEKIVFVEEQTVIRHNTSLCFFVKN